MRKSGFVIVDTAVWVDFFHRRQTPQVLALKNLARAGDVATGDLVLHEVLRGFADEQQRERVLRTLSPLICYDMLGRDRALRSASRYRELRRRGVTVRKPNDAIVASFCIDEHLPLLSSDRDFAAYRELGLDLVTG